MADPRLLLDAGNSRLKWAWVEGRDWREQGVASYAGLSALESVLNSGMRCYIASVAHQQDEERIIELLANHAITPVWMTSEAHVLDLCSRYQQPQKLGVDRWMGLIAARQRTSGPALVVSVGTAMTVDALSAEGVFLGGVIVPGMTMMQQSLLQGVAQVHDVTGEVVDFPCTTADAVQSGVIAALCGAIQLQHARLAQEAGVTPHCLMTGGGAASLLPYLELPVEHVPALVLEGIERVSREGTVA